MSARDNIEKFYLKRILSEREKLTKCLKKCINLRLLGFLIKKPMQNSKSARDTIATIQIKTPRKCANTQNTNVIKQNSTNARKN